MGFTTEEAKNALAIHRNDVNKALDYLLDAKSK